MALRTAQAARHAAHSILSEARFHTSPVPDPLHGVLVWVGRAISDPLGAIGRLVTRIGAHFPGGIAGAWVAAAMAAVVLTVALATRRVRARLNRALTANAVARPKAGDLEQSAEQAEREGRWNDAVRLRFRAGLLRLDALEGFRDTEVMPNRFLVRKLGSEPFTRLTQRFDEIVYGGDEATAADAEAQRRTWSDVLAEPRR